MFPCVPLMMSFCLLFESVLKCYCVQWIWFKSKLRNVSHLLLLIKATFSYPHFEKYEVFKVCYLTIFNTSYLCSQSLGQFLYLVLRFNNTMVF